MIKGIQLRDAIISGANNIINNKQMVDELNVFPVPDGDTGTNMSMTIGAAARELSMLPDDTVVCIRLPGVLGARDDGKAYAAAEDMLRKILSYGK